MGYFSPKVSPLLSQQYLLSAYVKVANYGLKYQYVLHFTEALSMLYVFIPYKVV